MKLLSALLFLLLFFIASCSDKKPLFQQVSSSHSGIHFNNHIIENDSINPLDLTNIYNGGGVGIGDFNNDGLQDIYFTGNLVSNKLYLNKGNFKFDDITKTAGVEGKGRWCRGVSVIDINNDGLMDMYVCASMTKDFHKRENLLYINQGIDKNGIPAFKEMAAEYGLNDTTHSTMAAFFDYDNDGDMDLYILVNQIIATDNPNVFRRKITDGSYPSTGRLYRNDWNADLKHPVFTNVSKQAGITIEGYGHGVNITDLNKDGWKDIYVTNDFNSNDILYINNHDGTFTDKASEYFKHTSATAMGQDVIDINNDGLSDIIALDMDPEDNYRKKMMTNPNNYRSYQNSDYYGYQYQYARNTLQLNQGARVSKNDSIGDPVFSEVGFFAGIAETDWSWAPVVTDFDNDGFRDIIITNGFPKDITDHDFINFRSQGYSIASKEFTLSQIPQVKLHNYAFRNMGNVTFNDVTADWGLTTTSFSNGAAYADLDNDGDIDVIVNNINDEAFVYENNTMNEGNTDPHYLSVQLNGDSLNLNGLGAWIELYYHGKEQVYEQTPYRGYLSSISIEPHFGLDTTSNVDSLVIKWADGKKQVLKNIATNQTIKISKKNADESYSWTKSSIDQNALFQEITDSVGVHFKHTENDFIDFNVQKLLPHKFSEYCPGLAAGDINSDGLDDFITGGSPGKSAMIFTQNSNGTFAQSMLLKAEDTLNKKEDDRGILLFDADGDGDLDLYIASGGYGIQAGANAYQDCFYINDGKGNYTSDTMALPQNHTSKFCVRAADFDHDGDLDLFIAGRVNPSNYPKPVSSFIYRNDSKNGKIKFIDVTPSIAPSLINIGMICDGIWTDFDNDGWQDLILAGEWMPVKFLKNDKGYLKDISSLTNINNKTGWWNSITCGDFDNDGDIDYVIGNLGENSFYKASDKYPISIYAKDFYNNGVTQCIITKYIKDKDGGELKEFTTHTRDDVVDQLPFLKKKYLTYKEFGSATFDKLFTDDELKNSIKYSANYFKSSFIRNNGNGSFTIEPLPDVAQYSVINGMITEDFDGDGNLDIYMNTNDYGTDPSNGRYDALNGLVLKGDGKGGFTPLSILQSGIFIPGDGKALIKLKSSSGNCLLVASQNKSALKIFELKESIKTLPLESTDISAILTYNNGKKQKREINYGTSFLSQSGRFLNIDNNVASVEIKDNKGKIRKISF